MGTCHHGMSRPRAADGGNGLQIWRQELRTADKGWSSILGVGLVARNSSLYKPECCDMFHKADPCKHRNEPCIKGGEFLD